MEESDQRKTKAERVAARQARQAEGGQRQQGAGVPPAQARMAREERQRRRQQAAQDAERERAREERQRQLAAQDAERDRARADRNEQFAAQMEERKESNRQQDRRTALAAAANSLGPETPMANIFKRAEELLVWLQKPL